MKIILCGGGTAGHINPAIAVAEEIKQQNPTAEILFIGRDGGKENDLVTKAGFPIKTLKLQGLRRSLSPDNFKSILYAIKARSEAKKIIKHFSPDIIIGTGGYVCWPVITAGKSLGIPVAIHESNVSPGLTTKLLSSKADIVLLNHTETKSFLSKKIKTKVVGNPLRSDFKKIDRDQARSKLGLRKGEILITSFGGSIGARKLNEVIIEVMKSYSSKENGVRHIHSMGTRYYSEEIIGYKNCRILPYIDNMPEVLLASDIVICRSGAITLSELSEVGVASILIPSPNVSDNHQYKNAKYLLDNGAAMLIEEKNLTAASLVVNIKELKNDENARKKRAKKIKSFSTPSAAKDIVKELFLLKNSNKKTVF